MYQFQLHHKQMHTLHYSWNNLHVTKRACVLTFFHKIVILFQNSPNWPKRRVYPTTPYFRIILQGLVIPYILLHKLHQFTADHSQLIDGGYPDITANTGSTTTDVIFEAGFHRQAYTGYSVSIELLSIRWGRLVF